MRGRADLRQRGRWLLTTAVDRAWAWVGSVGALTADHPSARRFAALGEGTIVAFPPGDRLGECRIAIGRDCFVAADVTLAVGLPSEPQRRDDGPALRIGDRCIVGRGSALVSLLDLVLEDDVTLAPNVYITDHNHTYADPCLPVGQQILQCQPVRIGAGTLARHQRRGAAGGRHRAQLRHRRRRVVRGAIPDHSVVAGVPGRVVRRWIEADGWQPPLRDRSRSPTAGPWGCHPPRGWLTRGPDGAPTGRIGLATDEGERVGRTA